MALFGDFDGVRLSVHWQHTAAEREWTESLPAGKSTDNQ